MRGRVRAESHVAQHPQVLPRREPSPRTCVPIHKGKSFELECGAIRDDHTPVLPSIHHCLSGSCSLKAHLTGLILAVVEHHHGPLGLSIDNGRFGPRSRCQGQALGACRSNPIRLTQCTKSCASSRLSLWISSETGLPRWRSFSKGLFPRQAPRSTRQYQRSKKIDGTPHAASAGLWRVGWVEQAGAGF